MDNTLFLKEQLRNYSWLHLAELLEVSTVISKKVTVSTCCQ